MSLRWRGDEVLAKARRAAEQGVRETCEAAATTAAAAAPVRTGELSGATAVIQVAGMHGRWGVEGVPYWLFNEFGTAKMPATPFLRPAAEAEHPQLAQRIAAAF